MSTNTRCALYTAAVLAACLIARANFAAESVPVVNVNTATVEQLAYLPGVGATLAGRIAEFRTAHGKPFVAVQELAAVKGIGRAKVERIVPYVVFEGPTTATEKIRGEK